MEQPGRAPLRRVVFLGARTAWWTVAAGRMAFAIPKALGELAQAGPRAGSGTPTGPRPRCVAPGYSLARADEHPRRGATRRWALIGGGLSCRNRGHACARQGAVGELNAVRVYLATMGEQPSWRLEPGRASSTGHLNCFVQYSAVKTTARKWGTSISLPGTCHPEEFVLRSALAQAGWASSARGTLLGRRYPQRSWHSRGHASFPSYSNGVEGIETISITAVDYGRRLPLGRPAS